MRQKKISNLQVLDFIRRRAESFILNEHFATGQNYHRTANSFQTYLTARNSMDAVFSVHTVRDYSLFLITERKVLRNTLSFYLRCLRASWVSLGSDPGIFQDAFTGVEPTRKRALPQSVLIKLGHLPLNGSKALWRDMFLFSFAARGMAFVDMAYLKNNDIRDGYINYCRHKTGHPLSIRIEPCIQDILNRWSCPGSFYVFPIISSCGARGFTEYQNGLSAYNKALRSMAKQVGFSSLSSYSARHTWASAAHNSGIPVSVIQEGMGHSSEKVTRIYLTQLSNTIIDNANRRLLTHLGL